MNNDLISRSALLEEFMKGTIISDDAYCLGIMSGIDHATKLVKDAPAVDAVEVIRCKDCLFWEKPVEGELDGSCNAMDGHNPGEKDFCSYAVPDNRKYDKAWEEQENEVCEACAITYSWERGEANVLGETNDADD